MIFYFAIIGLSVLLMYLTLKNLSVKEQSDKYKLLLFLVIILIISFRIIKYGSAMGLNVDEAMGGYNSWCLAHYGVDSHLMKLPIYLIAWGSGMNILYPAISTFLVRLFGLSLLSYRFQMVMLSILSMFTLYNALMNYIKKPKFNLLFVSVLYLNPWMIMANRWSLESNLFPIVMIFALSAFLLFLNQHESKKSMFWFAFFSFLLGLSAYAYSNDWIFLAIFTPVIFTVLFKIRKIDLKKFVIGIGIILVTVWPLLLFVYVNYFGNHTLHIGVLTIPKLWQNRSATQMIFGTGQPLISAMFKNLLDTLNMIANGDGMIWNSLPIIGLMFPGMFVFSIIGMAYTLRNIKDNILNVFVMIWFLCSIPTALFVCPDANHMNVLILPLFYFEAVAIKKIFKTKFLKHCGVIIFSLMLMWFTYGYFIQNKQSLSDNLTTVPVQLKPAFKKAYRSNKDVYFINSQDTGIYAIPRFWNPVSPYKFNDEMKATGEPKSDIVNYVNYYGKWHFSMNVNSDMTKLTRNTMFIVPSNDSSVNLRNLPNNVKKIGNYDDYTLYEN